MKYKDFDDYIEQAQPFAQPILSYFRECVLEACPEAKEDFKWSMPYFTYKGGMLCHMASFKQHTSFSFWLVAKMKDPAGIFIEDTNNGMGQLGKVTALDQMPEKSILIDYVREAMQLLDSGEKLPAAPKKKAKVFEMPEYLSNRINSNDKASATWSIFSQSHKNEYIEWITDAKSETTRERRMVQMMEWLEEGKPRNWKYMKNKNWE